jgi:uncharacterized membrane protein
VYELIIFMILTIIFECGLGIVYGIGVGYDPILVFPATILINFLTIILALFIIDRLMNWKKGLRYWIERRVGRARKYIDRYGWIGIIMGVVVLSPLQLAILGKLLGMKPSTLYPALFGAILVVATAFLGIALGVFKVLLA